MLKPTQLDGDVADEAPSESTITAYDERHFITYLRLLDAHLQSADWREVAKIVLHRDPNDDELSALQCWKSHLERAQWLSHVGYCELVARAVNMDPQ